MINKKMETEINDQINAEFWSAYLYLSMSSWFNDQNLPGFANWMYVQYQEEISHGMKMFRYIQERGGSVKLLPIAAVQTEWASPSDAFKNTLEHERKVTSLINHLMDTAFEIKDYASISFLNWYIDEQVEEEATADEILQALLVIEKDPAALRLYDKEFATRVFVDATLPTAE